MKKILGLLLISSSIFSMKLDIVNFENKVNRLNRLCDKSHCFQEKLGQYSDLNMTHSSKMRIEPASVFVPSQLESIELYHGKKGFFVRQDDKKHHIKKYDTDKILHNMTKEQLRSFLEGGYLSLNQMDNGEFSLKAKGRVNGGGIVGCWIGAAVGKVGVSLVGHGAIQLVALASGPGYWVTFVALESYFGAAIEAASIKGAIAGGMVGAVATGPV